MPELPEVETIRRGLRSRIVGRKMTRAEIFYVKSFIGEFRAGKVVEIRRFGKVLVIDLDNGFSLMIHLRMTGQVIFDEGGESFDSRNVSLVSGDYRASERFAAGHPSGNFVAELPNKQTRVVIEFEDGGKLYFNDQRKFGFIKVLKTAEVLEDEFIRKLGKEPWEMGAEEFLEILGRRKNSAIKAVLLDQTAMAGLGNIYADEALFRAGIFPGRKAGSLNLAEAEKLVLAAREVMEKSIEAGGSTMKNYVKADGTRGNYLDLFAEVYGREGKKCRRCGTEIRKIKIAGRGTHFCPKCQKTDSMKNQKSSLKKQKSSMKKQKSSMKTEKISMKVRKSSMRVEKSSLKFNEEGND